MKALNWLKLPDKGKLTDAEIIQKKTILQDGSLCLKGTIKRVKLLFA